MRYLIWAAIGLGLILLAFVIPAKAEPHVAPSSCITPAAVEMKLAAAAEAENIVSGTAAQRLADAISRHFSAPAMEVSVIVAFIKGGAAFVFGFDYLGCADVAGTMSLAVFDAARASAGLTRLIAPKPAGAPI
jgi:hypothetical protein